MNKKQILVALLTTVVLNAHSLFATDIIIKCGLDNVIRQRVDASHETKRQVRTAEEIRTFWGRIKERFPAHLIAFIIRKGDELFTSASEESLEEDLADHASHNPDEIKVILSHWNLEAVKDIVNTLPEQSNQI